MKPSLKINLVGIDPIGPDLDTSFDLVEYIYPFNNLPELLEKVKKQRKNVLNSLIGVSAPENFTRKKYAEYRKYTSLQKVSGIHFFLKNEENFLVLSTIEDALNQIHDKITADKGRATIMATKKHSTTRLASYLSHEPPRKLLALPGIASRLDLKHFTKICVIDPFVGLDELFIITLKVNNIYSLDSAAINLFYLNGDIIDFELQHRLKSDIERELKKYE